jgi:hypothetical protein
MVESTSLDHDRLQDSLKARRGPVLNTDATFMQGRIGKDQFETENPHFAHVGEMYRRKAEAAGVNTRGRYYLHSLANEPGDPEAWVDSKDDIRRVCEKRNWACDGAVKIGQDLDRDRPPPTPYRPADDLVSDRLHDIFEDNPESVPKSETEFNDLKEKVIDEMTPDSLKGVLC